jgi:hypothetical protein
MAKPNLNNNTNSKVFDDMEDAVSYLENVTGYKMDFVRDKKTKQKKYDWELVGKLIPLK